MQTEWAKVEIAKMFWKDRSNGHCHYFASNPYMCLFTQWFDHVLNIKEMFEFPWGYIPLNTHPLHLDLMYSYSCSYSFYMNSCNHRCKKLKVFLAIWVLGQKLSGKCMISDILTSAIIFQNCLAIALRSNHKVRKC